MTRREKMLADTLEAIRESAVGATEDVELGTACFVALADALRAIGEDAAEALADLPVCYTFAD